MKKELADRIVVDSTVLVGKPTIRGLRISVEQVLRALSSGVTPEDILADYPELAPEDIRAVLAYAADRVAEDRILHVA